MGQGNSTKQRRAANMANGQDKIYQMVTDRMVQELEKGNVPWHKPWHGGGLPCNLVSKRHYRGINVFILSMLGYASPYFLSFNQVRALGGKVKKGEHGIPVVFWKWIDIMEDQGDGSKKLKKIPFLRYYTVFNTEQTEGIDEKKIPALPQLDFNPIEAAEGIIKNMPNAPKIEHKEARAFYRPSTDDVNLPRKELFKGEAEYYCVAFHELGHATGHSSRLNRPEIGLASFFHDHAYSKEELVAEMTAVFLCNSIGIDSTWENSRAYIQNWLKSLKNDPKMLIAAAGRAQKAADYILNVKSEKEIEDENKAKEMGEMTTAPAN